MREDVWLGERLGCAAWTVEDGDTADELSVRRTGFFQAKVPTQDVTRVGALEQSGFRTIDVNVTMLRRQSDPVRVPGDDDPQAGTATRVREARAADRDAVTAIAEHEYTVSRFHLDPEIPDDVARTIKRDWVDNYFRGSRGDRMLVSEVDGEVTGFQLVLDTPGAAVIDLIAVAAAARGRGAGRSLVRGLVQSAGDRAVQTGTQVSNIGALRFYERLGFAVQSTQYVLHRHG